jgi:hypothetical protein
VARCSFFAILHAGIVGWFTLAVGCASRPVAVAPKESSSATLSANPGDSPGISNIEEEAQATELVNQINGRRFRPWEIQTQDDNSAAGPASALNLGETSALDGASERKTN